MLLQLNATEIKRIVLKHLVDSGFINPDSINEEKTDSALLVLDGEGTLVVGIGEEVPQYLINLAYDPDDKTLAEQADSNLKSVDTDGGKTQSTSKPAKRKRRTKAEIEADEAAEKAKAETETKEAELDQSTETTGTNSDTVDEKESEPEPVKAEVNPFGVSEQAVEAATEAAGSPANPFSESAPVESTNPFASEPSQAQAVTETSPDGFVKPAQDDSTLNLFN